MPLITKDEVLQKVSEQEIYREEVRAAVNDCIHAAIKRGEFCQCSFPEIVSPFDRDWLDKELLRAGFQIINGGSLISWNSSNPF